MQFSCYANGQTDRQRDKQPDILIMILYPIAYVSHCMVLFIGVASYRHWGTFPPWILDNLFFQFTLELHKV